MNKEYLEALSGLKHIEKYYIPKPCTATTYDYLETIKQALIKAQENERVLEIIKKKKVELFTLKHSKDTKEYNSIWNNDMYCLTEEEFELLTRWLENA